MNRVGCGLWWSAAVWVALFVALWQAMAVPMYDDISYERMVVAPDPKSFWEGEGKVIENWNEVAESSVNHYKCINGRLTNIIMFSTVLFPRWVGSILVGILAGLMFWGIMRAAGQYPGKRISAALVWLAALLIWWWLPWNDNMISRDYALNYVTPSATALIYAVAFLSGREGSRRLITALGIIAGLLTGLLHEGFSLPIIGASAVLIFFFSPRRKTRLAMTAALIAGALVCILAPSTFARIDEQSQLRGYFGNPMGIVRNLKPMIVPAAISVLLTALYIWKARKRRISDQKTLFWITAGSIGIAMAVVLGYSGRMLWLPNLCMLVYSLGLLSKLWNPKGTAAISAASVLAAIGILWSILFLRTENQVAKSQRELKAALLSSPDAIVYVSLFPAADIPWWTAGMIHQFFPTTLLWNVAYDYSLHRHPLILPEEFKGKSFEQWEKLPGDNPYRGFPTFWYSKEKIGQGTRLKATMGEKTANANPLLAAPDVVYAETGEPCYAIDAAGDTLWISYLNIPDTRRLKSLDIIGKP